MTQFFVLPAEFGLPIGSPFTLSSREFYGVSRVIQGCFQMLGVDEVRFLHPPDGEIGTTIDAICDFLFNNGELSMAEEQFMNLMQNCVEENTPFAAWYGGDMDDLPVAKNWVEVLAQLKEGHSYSPAEYYFCFHPQERKK